MVELRTKRALPLGEIRASETNKVAITPPRYGVKKFFEGFHGKYGIDLPFQDEESPSKRRKSPGHDAVRHINFLYYQDPEALSQALAEFQISSPTLKGNDARLNCLLDRLSLAVDLTRRQGTPRSKGQLSRSHWSPHSLLASQQKQHKDEPAMSAPPSPTLSVKHAPKLFEYPKLPPIMPAGPPPGTVPSPNKSGYTSLNTSCADISFNATSAHTSFWSEVPNGSQEPTSPATTIDSFLTAGGQGCTQQTIYDGPMSSMNESQFDTIESEAKSHLDMHEILMSSLDESTLNELEHVEHDGESRLADLKPTTSDELWIRLNSVKATDQEDPSRPMPHTHYGLQPQLVEDNLKMRPTADLPSESPKSKSTGSRPESFHVKRIPEYGISVDIPDSFLALPFELRLESSRLIQAGLAPENLEKQWQFPRTLESLHAVAAKLVPGFERGPQNLKGHSISAKLRWNPDSMSDRLFRLEFQRPNEDLPNAFQRKFGEHRFIFLEVDPLRPPGRFGIGSESEYVRKRFLQMLAQPQQILSRTWLQFYAQQKKSIKKGAAADEDATKAGITQFIFLALDGDGLEPLGLRDVVDFALRLSANVNESWCKLFSRLDLCASRTEAVYALAPHMVEFTDDTLATNDPPDEHFNDPTLPTNEIYDKSTVMDDGCSRAHPWLLRKARDIFDLMETPSAVQFRCAGGKGIAFDELLDEWDEHNYDPDAPPAVPLLRITKSQKKVTFKDDDFDAGYDPNLYTFAAVRASRPGAPSFLYLDFLPILVDRGVRPETIEELASNLAVREVTVLKDALKDTRSLQRWLYEKNEGSEDRQSENGIRTMAGFPISRHERAIEMVQSGFNATEFYPLGEIVLESFRAWKAWAMRGFRIPVFNSTMLIGIADPTGTLEPGEIQANFSRPCRDLHDDKVRWPSALKGPVLVARNPSARASDVQKVRAVRKPELLDFQNVVIFSVKGRRPLADKLSGGDYDGDTFWLCWEKALVDQFRNAPAPQKLPKPEEFGIEVDRRKVKDIIDDPSSELQVRKIVQMYTANRLEMSQLGVVTILHRCYIYNNGLRSETAERLADLKDLLMDSDKNGRSFSQKALATFKAQYNLRSLSIPEFFKHTSGKKESLENVEYADRSPNNIIDRIYFWVLEPTLGNAIKQVTAMFEGAPSYDKALASFYDETLKSADTGSIIQIELVRLQKELSKLNDYWMRCMELYYIAKQPSEKRQKWDAAVIECREMYDAIQPINMTYPAVVEWTRWDNKSLTMWEKLKASALAKFHNSKRIGAMWMAIAGHEICLLKAQTSGKPTRTLLKQRYECLGAPRNTRKRKRPVVDVSPEGESDEYDENNEYKQVFDDLGMVQ